MLRPDDGVPAATTSGDHVLMRAGFAVFAILLAFVIGRTTVKEPAPRVERVRERVMVTAPAPACPVVVKRRTTLEDVRRDWNMEGRLVCELRQRR